MKILILFIVFLLCTNPAKAQQQDLTISENLYSSLSDTLTHRLIASLNLLLRSIDQSKPDTTLIDRENYDFNLNFFTYLKGVEDKDTLKYHFRGQLINLYPIARSQYALVLAYLRNDEVGRIFTLHAREEAGNIVFANPIRYNARGWKTSTIGTITLHYPDTFNVSRAEKLHCKNVAMAQKLKLPVRDWELYMCRHYQEVLQLQGYAFEMERNGIVNSGYIVDPKTLFSVMNHEVFSHDLLHIYAGSIRGRERSSVECGLSYLWGDAYHVDAAGNVPEQEELIAVLQHYVQAHPKVRLLHLFENNPDVLAAYGYPKPIHVRYVIAGLIWAEIERQKGYEGIIAFLKCGRGFDKLFKSTEALIGLNRQNFNEKVYRLLSNS